MPDRAQMTIEGAATWLASKHSALGTAQGALRTREGTQPTGTRPLPPEAHKGPLVREGMENQAQRTGAAQTLARNGELGVNRRRIARLGNHGFLKGLRLQEIRAPGPAGDLRHPQGILAPPVTLEGPPHKPSLSACERDRFSLRIWMYVYVCMCSLYIVYVFISIYLSMQFMLVLHT